MAAFREHVTFSSLLGIGYGASAAYLFEFTPQQATIAGILCGMGGMLPDLDSPKARPGQIIFSLTAAMAPLLLVGHVMRATGLPAETENVILLMLGIYVAVRHGGAWIVDKLSVHRGMFHSIPAMGIAAEATYLLYPSELTTVKLLMGCGIAVGFFSHLFLDEVYSVKWNGGLPHLKKSFGTAIKLTSKKLGPTAVAYAMVATLSFLVFEEAGLVRHRTDLLGRPIATEPASSQPEPEGGFVLPPVQSQQAVLPPGRDRLQ